MYLDINPKFPWFLQPFVLLQKLLQNISQPVRNSFELYRGLHWEWALFSLHSGSHCSAIGLPSLDISPLMMKRKLDLDIETLYRRTNLIAMNTKICMHKPDTPLGINEMDLADVGSAHEPWTLQCLNPGVIILH